MRRLYFCLLLAMLGMGCFGQGWLWRKDQNSDKILVDSNRDLYVLKNLSPGFYIQKMNSKGQALWTFAGSGNISVKVIRRDPSNNLIVLANLASTSNIAGTTLTPNGKLSFCLLKIAPDGTLVSYAVYGSPDITFANDLYVTASGDYLIGGGFKGTFKMRGATLEGDSLQRFFIVKISANGPALWAEKNEFTTKTGEAFIDEITESRSGIVYALFTFYGLISYHGYNFQADGQFIAKLNNSRDFEWNESLDYPGLSGQTYKNLQTIGDTAYMACYFSHSSAAYASIQRYTSSKTSSFKSFGYNTVYTINNNQIIYAEIAADQPWTPTYYYRKIGTLRSDLTSHGLNYDSTVTHAGGYTQIEAASDGDFYLAGFGDGASGNFVGRYLMSGTTQIQPHAWDEIALYPNPSEGTFILHAGEKCVSVLNSAGDKIGFHAENNKVEIQAPAGIYLIEVANGNRRRQEKLVLR